MLLEIPEVQNETALHIKPAVQDPACCRILVTERAQPGRRFVAAWAYDFLASTWLSIGLVELANFLFGKSLLHNVPLLVVTTLIFLTRDYFFEGRGIGKNFLGLQVLDIKTGRPASLSQSVARNLVLLGPYLVYQLVFLIVSFAPSAHDQFFLTAAKNWTTIFGIFLLLIEGYFMHVGNGWRLADRLAGTTVIIQKPDFSNPFSMAKNS